MDRILAPLVLDDAAAVDGDHPDALRGIDGAASADGNQAIELAPNNDFALYWRGKAKRMIGDNAGGEIDIAAAKRINPNIGD